MPALVPVLHSFSGGVTAVVDAHCATRRAGERASLPSLCSPTFTEGRTLASTVAGALGFPEPIKRTHSRSKDRLRACCSPGTVPGVRRVYKCLPGIRCGMYCCGVSGRGRVSSWLLPTPCNHESLPLPFLIKFKSCEE